MFAECFLNINSNGFHIYHFEIFEMFSIKCFENIISQTFFVPMFSECLLNVYLQTLPNKDGGEQ